MLALLSTAMLYSAAWHSSAGVFRHVVLHPTHSGPVAAVTMASTDDENEMPYEGPPLPPAPPTQGPAPAGSQQSIVL